MLPLTLEEAQIALDAARRYPSGCGYFYFSHKKVESKDVVRMCLDPSERDQIVKYGAPDTRVFAHRAQYKIQSGTRLYSYGLVAAYEQSGIRYLYCYKA